MLGCGANVTLCINGLDVLVDEQVHDTGEFLSLGTVENVELWTQGR